MSTIQIKRSLISGHVPSSLQDGELAINEADEILFYKNSAGVIHSITLPVVSSATNILINGGMEIDQANNGAAINPAVTSSSLDNWTIGQSGSMIVNAQQSSDAPVGFSNSLKITVSTAKANLASTDTINIQQRVEGFRTSKLGFGTIGAQPVTLGFWSKTHRIGLYSGALCNFARTRSYPFSWTQNVADTWQYNTVTILGDLSGTWIGNTNACSLVLFFMMAGGSSVLGPAGSWASADFRGTTGTTNGVAATTDVFLITGVSILPGTEAGTAARSPLLKRSLDVELSLCQRYYWSSVGTQYTCAYLAVVSQASAYLAGSFLFPVQMRSTPTLSVVGSWALSNCNQPIPWIASPMGFSIYALSNAAGGAEYYPIVGAPSGGVIADARL